MSSFVQTHQDVLQRFTTMSVQTGSRSDYVQGGGGNTSCKLNDTLMAIKASGYCLGQITPDNAYAVLDYRALRAFYENTDPLTLEDVEKSGSDCARESTVVIEGLSALRPSVEAGFHSVLDRYVLHSHAIYANLICCTAEGAELADRVMEGLGESYAYVPYINPGAQLTFAISDAREQSRVRFGSAARVIFMENHGLIVTADDENECLRLHEAVNSSICRFMQVSFADWPVPQIAEVASQPSYLCSATPLLRSRLLQGGWDMDFFLAQALYPDQLVFLGGQLSIVDDTDMSTYLNSGKEPETKVTIFSQSGEILYTGARAAAQTIEETLYALFFITDTIARSGYTLKTMGDAGKHFIQNWESEKYRKSVSDA